MIPRSRVIKPAYFTSDELSESSIPARLLGISLLTLADRDGLLKDRPRRIKIHSLPFDDVDIDQLLGELVKVGYLLRYEVDEIRYIKILGFCKHQSVHHKEAESQLPQPQQVPQAQALLDSTTPQACVKQASTTKEEVEVKVEVEEEVKEEVEELSRQMLADLFNELCPGYPKVQVMKSGTKRWKDSGLRLKEHPKELFWVVIFKKVEASQVMKKWASFDWMMNPTNLLKIYEGNYDNNRGMTLKEEQDHYARKEREGREPLPEPVREIVNNVVKEI